MKMVILYYQKRIKMMATADGLVLKLMENIECSLGKSQRT